MKDDANDAMRAEARLDDLDIVRKLAEIGAELLKDGDPVRRAIGAGAIAYVAGHARSIDDALGLKPCIGRTRAVTRARKQARDAYVVELALQLAPGASHNAAAEKTKTFLDRYSQSAWKFDRDAGGSCASGASHRLAYQILKRDPNLLTARSIRRILDVAVPTLAKT